MLNPFAPDRNSPVIPSYWDDEDESPDEEPRPDTLAESAATDYRSPVRWGAWVIAVGVVTACLTVLLSLFYLQIMAAVGAALVGNRDIVMTLAFRTLLLKSFRAARLLLALALLAAILLLGWVHRLVANLPALNALEPRFTPSRAVALFAIPGVNLVYPYAILQEIWRGSDPDRLVNDGYAWRQNPGSFWVALWWTVHILTILLMGGVTYLLRSLGHQELTGWNPTYRVCLIARFAALLDYALLALMVFLIDQRQNARRRRLLEYAEITDSTDAADSGESAAKRAAPASAALVVLPTVSVGMALTALYFAVGLPVAPSADGPATGWRIFTPPDGRFSVDMPGSPIVNSGEAQASSEACVYQNENSEFAVLELTGSDQGEVPSPTARQAQLMRLANRNLTQMRAVIQKTTFISQHGINGLEVLFTNGADLGQKVTQGADRFTLSSDVFYEANSDWQGTARFFLHGGMLYEVLDLQNSQTGDSKASQRFQESFRLRK